MKTIWQFSKMHGLGNDYIYFNCLDTPFPHPEKYAIPLSDRHFGIGGDGIVLIMKSKTSDFRMRMFNADGSEAEMCGNAIRCVGKYLFDKKITGKTTVSVETLAGEMVLELDAENETVTQVRVDMGEPILSPADIPVECSTERYVNQPYDIDDFQGSVTCVSMGNPHAVFFVEELNDNLVLGHGPKIEVDPLFPRRINVEFVKVINKQNLEMRVWERGSGETLACGTGAAAVCVAAALNELADRKVSIKLLGGVLELEWAENNHVYKSGPATFAFEGEVDLSDYTDVV